MEFEQFRDENGHLVLDKRQRESLVEAGISTVEMLATTPLQELVKLAGFGEKSAKEKWQHAKDTVLGVSFVSAKDYYERQKSKPFLTTGSKALDGILGGGVKVGELTEFWGEETVGKSQLCMQLSVNVQLPSEKGGLNGGILYFDTEGQVRGDRIIQMAKELSLNEPLNNIIVARCYTSDHQRFLLDNIGSVIEKHNIKLIVVDSLIVHFRSEYMGREQLALRQQLLNKYIHKLQSLATTYNLAVVVTNQAVANPDVFGVDTKPTGGHVVGHGVSARIWIRKGKSGVRIARLQKSPWLPESECIFKITEKGIEDQEEKKQNE